MDYISHFSPIACHQVYRIVYQKIPTPYSVANLQTGKSCLYISRFRFINQGRVLSIRKNLREETKKTENGASSEGGYLGAYPNSVLSNFPNSGSEN